MGQKRNMPTRKKIFEYWQKEKKWLTEKFPDQDENMCFACGRKGFVERCHLIEKVYQGLDDVSNLHILCKSCHFKTEGKYRLFGEKFYYAFIIYSPHWLSEWESILVECSKYDFNYI
jgi:CRISPR/Cas system-associated protein Cas10 (large subunit of type III CRISPR-Cas system)